MPPSAPTLRERRRCLRGFTIVELLAVMAVVVILAAILIPAVSSARKSALRAKTRVQFSQWATAIEGFRAEYGYYPNFATSLVNGSGGTDQLLFRELLTGRPATGPSFTSSELAAPQNKKRIGFITFGQDDLQGELVQDAFGSTAIAVLVDKNYDGMIAVGTTSPPPDYTSGSAPQVGSFSAASILPAQPIRAGVLFYSAGDGETPVTSWNPP